MSEFHDELPEVKQTTEHGKNIKDEEEPLMKIYSERFSFPSLNITLSHDTDLAQPPRCCLENLNEKWEITLQNFLLLYDKRRWVTVNDACRL